MKGNTVDHANDVGNLARGVVDALHGCNHLPHNFSATHCHARSIQRELVGFARTVGILVYGGTEFLHRRRRLLQGTGLTLGTAGQVHVAGSDFL